MTEDEITAHAKVEYFSKKGRYANPYKRGTSEYDAYERGWMQALKRDGGKQIDSGAPVVAPTSEHSGVNLYAKMKGRVNPTKPQ